MIKRQYDFSVIIYDREHFNILRKLEDTVFIDLYTSKIGTYLCQRKFYVKTMSLTVL